MLDAISDMTWLCPCCDVLVFSVAQPSDCAECDCPGEDFEQVSELARSPRWVEL